MDEYLQCWYVETGRIVGYVDLDTTSVDLNNDRPCVYVTTSGELVVNEIGIAVEVLGGKTTKLLYR